MAWTGAYIADSGKKQLLDLLLSSALKAALYDNTPSFTAATSVYTTTGEITGTNYIAGGKALTSGATAVSGNIAYLDFADITWTSASFTTYGSMIYNTSVSNKTFLIIDFGGVRQVIGGTFAIVLPAADNTHAFFRIV